MRAGRGCLPLSETAGRAPYDWLHMQTAPRVVRAPAARIPPRRGGREVERIMAVAARSHRTRIRSHQSVMVGAPTESDVPKAVLAYRIYRLQRCLLRAAAIRFPQGPTRCRSHRPLCSVATRRGPRARLSLVAGLGATVVQGGRALC